MHPPKGFLLPLSVSLGAAQIVNFAVCTDLCLHMHNARENGWSVQIRPLEFQIPSENWGNKPSHKERYDHDNDEFTSQCLQLVMTTFLIPTLPQQSTMLHIGKL
jgi:hypothetical protein